MIRRLTVAVSIAVLPALLNSCAGKAGGFQMPPMPVEVVEVKQQAVSDQFHALGSIEAHETVNVVSEVNAVVRELPFSEGQAVRKGHLLAHLDDVEIGAEAVRAEALRDQARVNRDRIQQLFDQKAASPQELDDASASFKVADANARVADARLSKTRILSPLDGVAGRRLVSPGAFLKVGDAITEVAEIDVVKISFAAPERYLSHMKSGSRVSITTAAYPNQVFQGRVSVVDPILDPTTRTVQLVAVAANPGRRLRPGMSADVSATLSERPDALTVPDEAVFAQGDQSFVFVVKADSSVTRQAIVIGSRDSARVEVAEGLHPGDKVVQAGYQKLFEGAKVLPIPAGGMMGPGPGAGGPPGAAAGGAGAGAKAGTDPKAGGAKRGK
jgi:membrane fusion protein (multidrug efflux system)